MSLKPYWVRTDAEQGSITRPGPAVHEARYSPLVCTNMQRISIYCNGQAFLAPRPSSLDECDLAVSFSPLLTIYCSGQASSHAPRRGRCEWLSTFSTLSTTSNFLIWGQYVKSLNPHSKGDSYLSCNGKSSVMAPALAIALAPAHNLIGTQMTCKRYMSGWILMM
jgi:hypothetical protein